MTPIEVAELVLLGVPLVTAIAQRKAIAAYIAARKAKRAALRAAKHKA
jgi:heme exporter protein D